jgi:hypothetical protein
MQEDNEDGTKEDEDRQANQNKVQDHIFVAINQDVAFNQNVAINQDVANNQDAANNSKREKLLAVATASQKKHANEIKFSGEFLILQ